MTTSPLPVSFGIRARFLRSCFAAAFLGLSSAAFAATFTVSNTNDSGSGSLRQALADALAAGTGPHVINAGGVTGTVSLQSALPTITNSNITINGPVSGTLTVTRGAAANFRIFYATNASGAASLTINRLTMTNGVGTVDMEAVGVGGGIAVKDATLVLNYCTVSGCTAASNGGGIHLGGTVASNGTLNYCTISGNTSTGGAGGGISATDGTASASHILNVNNSTISGNSTGTPNGAAGGGVTLVRATGTFRNCTISGNTSGSTGGGVNTGSSAATFNAFNCTITNNTCTTAGGGIRGSGTGGSVANLTNTLVVGNKMGASTPDDTNWGTGTRTAKNSVIGVNVGTAFNTVTASQIGTSAAPKFVNLGALGNNGGVTQTHALQATNPELAINLGSNADAGTLPSDQRGLGFNRFNGTVDIGAYETGVTAPTFTGVAPLGAPAQVNNSTTLAFAVPPGTNRMLAVLASSSNSSGQSNITGVTFNGTSMTSAVTKIDGQVASDSIWYLALGTATTAASGNVVVTVNTGTVTNIGAIAFQNVHQTTPMSGGVSTNSIASGVPATLDVASAAGDAVIDLYDIYDTSGGGVSQGPTAGQAVMHNVDAPGSSLFGYYQTGIKPGAPSVTCSWTSSGAGAMILVAANIKQAVSSSPPTVTTTTQSDVTHNSATLGGNVTADGGASVTERGIVWGASADPTTANNKVSNGSGTGSFSGTVTGLPSSTTVHVRAYATNAAGTSYGSNISFATAAPPAPEIAVEQPAGANIADGGSKGFGSVNYGSTASLTFTIKNTGNADLTGLAITKDGTHSSDFSVTASPTAPVSGPSGSTTFTVQFAPGGGGSRTAAIHIASNDGDENPFDINLSGTGVLSSNAGLSDLLLSAGTLSPSFTSGATSYTASVSNGTTSLTVTPTVSEANATITVNGASVTSGNASGAISLNVGANTITTVVTAHDGTTTKTYTTTVTRAAPPAPEIAVEQPSGTGLTDGSASISFGSQAVGSSGSPLTFTIRNTGTADLTLTGISKDGTNGLDFTVSSVGSSTLSAGGSTTFTVTFSPIAAGSRSAAIHIASNDSDEASFDIALTGTGAVSNNANLSALALSTGTLAPAFASGTTSYTATVPNPVTSVTLTATTAQANASLTINGSAAISGNPSGALSLNVGANTLTTVVTAQDGITTKTYTVVVTRDPPSPQEIAVEQPSGTDLVDGSASVDFGNQTVSLTGAPLTFVIRNSGGADLTLGSFTKNGANAADFTVSAPGLTTIPPAGSTTFTVTFTPGAAGARSAALHIASNDSDENPFDISLAGTGVSAGIIDIDATATISVFEEAGTVEIPLVRTGSSTGAISVKISTVNGTAKAPGDFTALTNYVVNFADGETSKNVPITIIADSLASEINEFFSVQLSAPAGGATLGSTTTASVRIVEPDLVIPTVSITAPGANANIAEGAAKLTGTVTDAKGLARAEYSLNGGAWTPLPVTLNSTGLTGSFSLPLSPEPGANTVRVRGYDFRDNISNDLTRSFTYVVLRPLALTINPAAGGTVTFTPALSSGKAQVGLSYTLKATPKAGYLWDAWTAPGVSGAAADASTLVITMVEGLAITADFVENTIFDGAYTGLATPQTGVTPNANNLGLFSGTLSTIGTFSGKVNFGGTAYLFTAKFDPVTMTSTGANTSVSYNLHLDSPTSKMTGTITLLSTGDTCDVDADLAVFSTAAPVPAQFLNAATTGTYTVVFAAKEQTPARDHHDYPQGDGVGKFTLYSSGTTSLSGTLADGTTITLSAPLSKDHRWPLAALIKGTSTAPATTLGGWVQFDTTQNDSDVSATDLRWFRTALPTATSYAAGWSDGITVDAVGALYASATNMQTTLQLGAADTTNGNGKLEFTEGKLTSSIAKTNFNLVTNTVTKMPATDPSFTLAPAAGTGTFSGSFAPNWSNPAAIKPTYRGTVLQKGANRGGYGFFISNAVGDTAAESGRVTLGPP